MFVLGFFMDLYRPAVSAAVIDLVPVEKQTRAFGYIYWAINFGAALAPIAAGFLANIDFFLLFAGDALTTAIFGVIVLARVPESQARGRRRRSCEPEWRRGSGIALRDSMLLAFVLLSLFVGIIYSQGQVTLPLDMAANGLPPERLRAGHRGQRRADRPDHASPVSRMAERGRATRRWRSSALLLGIGFGLTGLADRSAVLRLDRGHLDAGRGHRRRRRAGHRGRDVAARVARPVSGDLGLVVGARVLHRPGTGRIRLRAARLGQRCGQRRSCSGSCCASAYLALSVPATRRAKAAALSVAAVDG